MAEFIRLAAMPKGKSFKTLSKYERMYIDDNWKYEQRSRMADILQISYLDVAVYCDKNNYKEPKKNYRKPKEIPKEHIFDVDNYHAFSI